MLLKIPIRRISLYDINKAKNEMAEIKSRLKEIKHSLEHIIDYSVAFLQRLLDKYGKGHERKTELVSFEKVDVREAAQRNLKLRYDKNTGYLGYDVNGNVLFDVSPYDRILVIRKSGAYSVIDTPDKIFVDKGMHYCSIIDKESAADTIFNLVYRQNKTGYPFVKRCKIEKYILNRGYSIVPENCTVLALTTGQDLTVHCTYKPKPRIRVLEEDFAVNEFLVKGVKAQGVRLANREVKSAKFIRA
jgi:topoisomerase-4 subunit A